MLAKAHSQLIIKHMCWQLPGSTVSYVCLFISNRLCFPPFAFLSPWWWASLVWSILQIYASNRGVGAMGERWGRPVLWRLHGRRACRVSCAVFVGEVLCGHRSFCWGSGSMEGGRLGLSVRFRRKDLKNACGPELVEQLASI